MKLQEVCIGVKILFIHNITFVKNIKTPYNEVMISEDLVSFVRIQLAARQSPPQIKKLLLTEGGWDDADVEEVFRSLGVASLESTPVPDDFLGIFSGHEAIKKPDVKVTEPHAVAPKDIVPAAVDSEHKNPESVLETMLSSEHSKGNSTEEAVKEAPEIKKAEKFKNIPLDGAASPIPKFDLSVFRKNVSSDASTAPVPLAGNTQKPIPKTAESKSPIKREGRVPLVAMRTMMGDVAKNSSGAPLPVSAAPAPLPAPTAAKNIIKKELLPEKPEKREKQVEIIEKPQIIPEKKPEAKPEATPEAKQAEARPEEKKELVGEKTTKETAPETTKKTIEPQHVIHPERTPIVESPALEHRVEHTPVAPPVFREHATLDLVPSPVKEAQKASVPHDPTPKFVQTKSIAEVWLQSGKETDTGSEATHPLPRVPSSDTLLRGKGKVIPGVPAFYVPPTAEREPAQEVVKEEVKTEPNKNPFSGISREPMEIVASPGQKRAHPEFIDTIVEKKITKRALPFVAGILVTVLLAGGVLYTVLTLRGPDLSILLSVATRQFYDLETFAYQGAGSADLILSTATDGPEAKGKIKFSIDYNGVLQNGSQGYGDGMHQVKFAGGLESGEFTWETDIEADIYVLGQVLYFHVLSFPEGSAADPELFKTYWVEVDLAEIAKELALDGLKTGLENYGEFDGGRTTLTGALQKNFPFTVDRRLADGIEGGIMSHHFRLKSNPEHMAELVRIIYRAYTNKEIALNVNQELRFTDALKKISADVWVDTTTGALVKFAFGGTFDDDIAGVHVAGPLAFSFTFADFNKPVTVNQPSPVLSLEELRVRMDDHKILLEKRTNDQSRIDTLRIIEQALADYFKKRGRYPTLLSELAVAKVLPSAISSETLKPYFYAPYTQSEVLAGARKCAANIKTCTLYHIGVNLEDVTHPALADDADKTSAVLGDDGAGCGAEKGFACFDTVSPKVGSGN